MEKWKIILPISKAIKEEKNFTFGGRLSTTHIKVSGIMPNDAIKITNAKLATGIQLYADKSKPFSSR